MPTSKLTICIESDSLKKTVTEEASCQAGLNIVQASDLELIPGRDLIVFKEDGAETYFAVELSSRAKLDGLRNGDGVKISFPNDTERPSRTGKILRFADNTHFKEPQTDMTWMKTIVSIAGESHTGLIRNLKNPEDAVLHAEPFTDDIVLEKEGHFYQITIPSEFSDLTVGDEIEVGYVARSFSGSSENNVGFSATVHSFVDVEKKQKYLLTKSMIW